MTTQMNWKLLLLRTMVVVNVIAGCAVLVQDMIYPSYRVWGRFIGAITMAAVVMLFLTSIACIRTYRRIALLGLCVAMGVLLLGLLSPEL